MGQSRPFLRAIIALMLQALYCFAGQSLSTTSAAVKNDSFTAISKANAMRAEFYIHDWPSDPASQLGSPVVTHAAGFYCQFTGTSQILFCYSYWASAGADFQIPLSGLPNRALYVRWQHDPAGPTETVEGWDTAGNRVFYKSQVITLSAGNDPGVTVGGNSTGMAFFRVHTTLVPANSRPPVTADNANVALNWKFDGDLTDSSGNGWTAVTTGGAVSYMTTPHQNVVVAKAKTMGAPSWSDWISLRAGKDNQLDGTASYSQSDLNAAVTYSWSNTAGGTVLWDSTYGQTSATPIVRGLVFGQYTFSLSVTDGTNVASTSLTVGAVATDDNYVVVNADPNVDKIFGPMMAFGRGPWGYMDERALKATTLRAAAYTAQGLNPPSWQTPFAGTVSYRWGGDTDFTGRGTTLATAINATDTSIVVADATALNFTDLPTRITLAANYYSTLEEVRICSVAGNTLTVCSGGRASHGTAASWPVGTKVGQLKVKGTGTAFLSTICGAYSAYSLTLHYTRADSSDAQKPYTISGCESDTTLYLAYVHYDIGAYNGQVFSGVQYSAANATGYTTQYGPNFYGEDLAHRALYYRSGLTAARTAANVMSGQYISSPYISGGDGLGISPLLYGGGTIGAIAGAVLDPQSGVSWSDLRGMAALAAPNANIAGLGACNTGFDSREHGYAMGVVALMAAFDPSPSSRATWLAAVQQDWTREQTCKGSDNSWANAGYKWSTTANPPLTVTNGSAIATGTGFTAGMCGGVASGTMTVTKGSASVTGTGFVAGNKIAIVGTNGGQPFHAWYQFQLNSSTSITMSALWPGDSGTVSYLIENDDALTAIGTNFDDARLATNWSCTYNSSTQITLNRPWAGTGTETVYLFRSNIPGKSQQPYMTGIQQKQFDWSALSDTTHDWAGLSAAIGAWQYTTGFDTVTKGLFYGRVLEGCEPATTPPSSPIFTARTPGCNMGLDGASVKAARTLNAEGMSSLIAHYKAAPDSTRKTAVDTAYGAVWGNPTMTTGGVYYPPDGLYVVDENSDISLGAYKWTGFFFGMGMAHQWPAARLGGVLPANTIPYEVSFSLPVGATSARIMTTAPSGATQNYSCVSSPCSVTVDLRQGTYWGQTTYLDAGGATVRSDAPVLLIYPAAYNLKIGGSARISGNSRFN